MLHGNRLFTEFERRARQLASGDAFAARFGEASRRADHLGMIEALLSDLETDDLPIRAFFCGKSEAEAERLHRRLMLDEDADADDDRRDLGLPMEERAELASAALACAPADSELFFDALEARARAWYRAGDLARCAEDCGLLAARRLAAAGRLDERRIGALIMLAEARRAAGGTPAESGKRLTNEAMRAIDELARERGRRVGDEPRRAEEDFKEIKAEILRGVLEARRRLLMRGRSRAAPIGRAAWSSPQIKTPAIEGKVNELLPNCSNAIALGHDKIKGRLLYAMRDIEPNTVLIVDRPFSFSTDVNALNRNCLNCHASLLLDGRVRVPCNNCQAVKFCSEECRQQAWNKFHKYECRIFNYFYENKFQRTNVLLAYRTVVTAALQVKDGVLKIDQEFLELHKYNILNTKELKKFESHDYKSVFSLQTHCGDSAVKENLERAIHSVFFAKCLIRSLHYFHPDFEDCDRLLCTLAVAFLHNMQIINCNAYEIVENIRNEDTKILEPRNIGGAIYSSVSLTNHSCYPNIVRHSFPCGVVVVKSIRFIQQGSELLDCYGQHFLENKREVRRKLLAEKYYFKCQCLACSFDWPVSLPNDQFNFKCKKCSKQYCRSRNAVECTACGHKSEISKLYTLLQNSIKKRLTALTKMYDGCYQDALPLLLEHASCIHKIMSEPSLEAVKTQQSIIQCLNAMSSTSI